MAAQAQDATLHLPFRWLLVPAALWSAVTAAAILLKRRAQQPSMPRMSDEWLNSHATDRTWHD